MPPTSADPRRLRRDVEALVGVGPRDIDHPDGLDRAAAAIEQELARVTRDVSRQAFAVAGATYCNVIARFGGAARDRIVVGAHYDAAGPLPGADDNASGVAGLLEIARLLASEPPRVPVELVAYTLEEPPAFATSDMGSEVHAAALAASGAQVRIMFGLEMIGYFSDVPRTQRFPLPGLGLLYPDTANFIAVVGRLGQRELTRRVRDAMRTATPLPVESIAAPRFVPGVDLSDHRNYWDRGWPAVMITDTAMFRNPNYHEASDTPETLDYVRMAQVATGVYAAVRAFATRD